jgi:hypothetical protein
VDTRLRLRAIERDLAKQAADHAARRMTTEAYLAEHARLTAELDALVDVRPAASMSDGDRIVRFLRDLKLAWEKGGEAERANLVASVYDRVIVTDRGIVEVELTEDAMRHGLALALALPERVKVVLARPARAGRTVVIPILRGHREGRRWRVTWPSRTPGRAAEG